MIRAHRIAHRYISITLLVLLPVLMLAGLIGRNPTPVQKHLPEQIRAQAIAPQMTLRLASNDLWSGLPITSLLFGDDDDYLLFMYAEQVLAYPDLLVYWSESPTDPNVLPDAQTSSDSQTPSDSQKLLLGALSTAGVARFELESAIVKSEGELFLYSLGHQRRIGSVKLPLNLEPNVEASRGNGL